jgi:hypothetical protein
MAVLGKLSRHAPTQIQNYHVIVACIIVTATITTAAAATERVGFPEFLLANAGIVPLLGHVRFLPNPSQFIIHRYTV